MATKKSLLQEALADAKELKQVAFENAKAAINETFTPQLKKMVTAALHEEEDEKKSSEEEIKENDAHEKAEYSKGEKKDWSKGGIKETEEGDGYDVPSEEEAKDEHFDLDELLKELESEEDPRFGKSEEDGKPMDEKKKSSSEESKESQLDAPPGKHDDVEYQTYLKLRKKFEPEMKEDATSSEDDQFSKDSSDAEPGEEETEYDVDEDSIEAIIRELEKGSEEDSRFGKGEEDGKPLDEKHGDPEKGKGGQPVKEAKKKSSEESSEDMKSEYAQLMEQFNDMNLLNAKLLYLNKIVNEHDLSRSEKVSILKQFDRTTNLKEVKLVYSIISESLKPAKTIATKNKKQIKESLGLSSKPSASTAKKESPEILNENSMYNRFQILAGLKKID